MTNEKNPNKDTGDWALPPSHQKRAAVYREEKSGIRVDKRLVDNNDAPKWMQIPRPIDNIEPNLRHCPRCMGRLYTRYITLKTYEWFCYYCGYVYYPDMDKKDARR